VLRASELSKSLGPHLASFGRRHGLRTAVTLAVAFAAIRAVLEATGGTPAVPLDDAFIHFQYARSFWEGRGLSYSPGAEPAAGATSLLWPLLLTLPYGLGLREESIIWAAWLFGFVALGFLAHETRRSCDRLLSRDGALAAELMVLAFGGNVWFAASGMEVIPLAWILMRSARRAASWWESGAPRSRPTELVVLAVLAPLLRPEGALSSVSLAAVILAGARGRSRLFGLAALGAPLLPALVNLAAAGTTTTTTAAVKWLPMSPYLDAAEIVTTARENVAVLFGTLLDGKIWSAVFLPERAGLVLWPAVPALIALGVARRARVRGALLAAVALGMLLPTTYDSFLWNRLRYLWPFVAPWFIGVAALAEGAGALAARLDPALARLRLLASGAAIGALVSHLGWTLEDLGTSADAIRKQQASLGHWARHALSKDAVLGVNDTGAIAYFSERRTFDVVGLTTAGEARYWAAGAGSRFEHYERLGPDVLPGYFIVYPEWFALPVLLGDKLTERSVPGATILGGVTMEAHVADYSSFGSGAHPLDPSLRGCKLLDTLDVADLESERDHDYELLDATSAGNVALVEGDRVDGGRKGRTLERFRLKVAPGVRVVARVESDTSTELELSLDGRPAARAQVEPGAWREVSLPLPRPPHGRVEMSVRAEPGAVTSMHYFSVTTCP
jgi:hypothetical protein